jgi:hypothetical protein
VQTTTPAAEHVERVRNIYLAMNALGKEHDIPLDWSTPSRAHAYTVINLVAGWLENQVTIDAEGFIMDSDLQTAIAVTMWIIRNEYEHNE